MSGHLSGAAPVVVGVDGSESSLAAVDLAAAEAALRGLPLLIVHAFYWPYLHVPLGPSPVGPPEGGLEHQAQRMVTDALARARASLPPAVQANAEVVAGAPTPVLLDCARDATMVVIGDRGLGGFAGLLLGSVAVQLTSHASCPVLVARGSTLTVGGSGDTRPVVLGVDGSPASDTAVGFAFAEAALRGVPLKALHAWREPEVTRPGDLLPLVYDVDQLAAEEERVLAEALAGWPGRYPDVEIQRALVRRGARAALIEATGSAQLVVVGTRGLGGFAGLLLGSVSQAVVHHASCPVAVVPQARA